MLMKVNLGCGYNKPKDFVNVDNRAEVNPDLIADATFSLPFKDNSVDEITANDFLEHLERDEVVALMNDIWRVLKPKGRLYHKTPSSDGRGCWQDPTHKSAWNINTWKFYFVDKAYRELYGTKANFKILYLEDRVTDRENRIIHTHCGYEAVK